MVTTDGETVGEHHGLAYYTIGQRHGLGLGGRRNGRDMPWFVVAKDIERNVLVVAQGDDDPRLYADVLTAVELAWVAGPPASLPFPCRARVRYRQSARPCTIEALAEERCTVRFAQAQRAITPGQYVVFYSGDECLGGGVIASAARDRL
jgi:tRNA-specific 2-thiouridylase